MDNKKNAKILVVDDEKTVRDFLNRFLSLEYTEVKTVENGFQAIEAVRKEKYDLVFMDIRMPKLNGIEAFRELKIIDSGLKCVMMTGYALEEKIFQLVENPGIALIRKPFESIGQIREITDSILQDSAITTEESFKNKRSYARLDIELPVMYRVKESRLNHTEELIASSSRNISLAGIRILTPEKLVPAAKLDLFIKDQANNETCHALGEVVWSNESTDRPGYYNAGIKFIEVDLTELTAFILRYGKVP